MASVEKLFCSSLGRVSGAPADEGGRALLLWRANEGSCSRNGLRSSEHLACKALASIRGVHERSGSRQGKLAKAVRRRHTEIDDSEKLMEDPYGHVCDVMSRNVATVKGEELACIKDGNKRVVWSMDMDVFGHYTGVPVVDSSGRCVGVLTAADYENRVGKRGSDEWRAVADAASRGVDRSAVPPLVGLPASAIMSSPAIVIKEHAPIAYAAALMLQYKVHRLPVVDAEGVLVGIISRTDIFEPISEVNPMYHALVGKHRDELTEGRQVEL